MNKYIFITGGVLSSLGKGIAAASIGAILKNCGLKISILKIDPYLNIDPGTMSPLEHGEVFVTADGAECDLDLGHYERFLDEDLSKINNFTTGVIYESVIAKERRGEYLGKTVQIIPHVVEEIKERIKKAASGKDLLIVEIGGTVGDIEGLPFLEAIRSLRLEVGRQNAMNIHLTLIPYIKVAGELKTKPTQHSVQELRRIGISPDMIICRSEKELAKALKEKIAISCGVDKDCVIESIDAPSIYQIPLNFLSQDILKPISELLALKNLSPRMSEWDKLVKKVLAPTKKASIAFVGKYIELKESYKSLTEALIHAGAALDAKVEIKWIDSSKLEGENIAKELKDIGGILVAGGFGQRGAKGKMAAIKYAREEGVPFLGICLGMQLALIEFASNVLGLEDANSTEFDKACKNPLVYLIDEFIDAKGEKQVRTTKSALGGTMRLGEYKSTLKKGSKLAKIYNKEEIKERHRHRYEANEAYFKDIEAKGLVISAKSKDLAEAVELKNHPFFIAVQYHPEFSSRLINPNPLIREFVKASLC